MIKTIFDLMRAQKEKEDKPFKFNEFLNINGEWKPNGFNSNSYKNCILISKDNKYKYYLCWDYEHLDETIIKRKKI